MRRMGVMAMALAAAITVGCDRNDNRTANDAAVGTAGRDGANAVGIGDRDFVRDVATMNMAEIELSRTALERAADANVKKFAQMMVDDHTGAGDKLKAFASQHKVELPAQIDDKHRDLGEKLRAKQGLEFDKEYADAMVQGHEDFVDKLESRIDKDTLSKWKAEYERKTGDAKERTDAEVKAVAVTAEKSDNPVTQSLNQWAADTYPVAFAHLQAAKDMRDGVRKKSTT
jgi:putative membrane protein